MNGVIISLGITTKKHEPRIKVEEALFKKGIGILEDIHSGKGHRQISLLAI